MSGSIPAEIKGNSLPFQTARTHGALRGKGKCHFSLSFPVEYQSSNEEIKTLPGATGLLVDFFIFFFKSSEHKTLFSCNSLLQDWKTWQNTFNCAQS